MIFVLEGCGEKPRPTPTEQRKNMPHKAAAANYTWVKTLAINMILLAVVLGLYLASQEFLQMPDPTYMTIDDNITVVDIESMPDQEMEVSEALGSEWLANDRKLPRMMLLSADQQPVIVLSEALDGARVFYATRAENGCFINWLWIDMYGNVQHKSYKLDTRDPGPAHYLSQSEQPDGARLMFDANNSVRRVLQERQVC